MIRGLRVLALLRCTVEASAVVVEQSPLDYGLDLGIRGGPA
jgi:hypothetical protein